MVREILRLDPEILQAGEPPNPADEIDVRRPKIGVQPDQEHKKQMRMRIERLGQHVFDKAIGCQIAFLAIQLGKGGSTFHKAAGWPNQYANPCAAQMEALFFELMQYFGT